MYSELPEDDNLRIMEFIINCGTSLFTSQNNKKSNELKEDNIEDNNRKSAFCYDLKDIKLDNMCIGINNLLKCSDEFDYLTQESNVYINLFYLIEVE